MERQFSEWLTTASSRLPAFDGRIDAAERMKGRLDEAASQRPAQVREAPQGRSRGSDRQGGFQSFATGAS